MSIPGSLTPLFNSGDSGYKIERSLRFNSADSAYLSRTPASAGNRKTWTWSGWVKRAGLGTFQTLLHSGADSENATQLRFNSADTIKFEHQDASVETGTLVTSQVFRDVSSWYHIVLACDTTQATDTNRLKLYVNGTQVTTFSSSTYPSQNADLDINTTTSHRMGGSILSTNYLSGYLADIHFIDGQALTPSSFTEVSATTGQLIPKAYSGSFGTNGFWLKFSDNSAATATTLGKDYSGNSNNWTPNNLSVTAGAGNDSLVDTPTSYGTDTGAGGEVRGNYATFNPLVKLGTSSLANGNLDALSTGPNNSTQSTIAVTTGKWYAEFVASAQNFPRIGIQDIRETGSNMNGSLTISWGAYSTGELYINGVNTPTGGNIYLNGDVIGVAFDADTRKVWFSKNGTWVNFSGSGANPATGTNPVGTLAGTSAIAYAVRSESCTVVANFGQRPFAYAAPSGFKALCDTNLPDPTIAKPSTVMDVKLYTGNGSTQNITGLNFSPDFVWGKVRAYSTNHMLADVVRGATKRLISNLTNAEDTGSALTSFNSDGFSLDSGSAINQNGEAVVAWTWDAGSSTVTNTQGSITSQVRANASAGFSIVTYTGTGVTATVGHGLGVAPSMIMFKCRSSSTPDWLVYHSGSNANPANGGMYLNRTDGFTTDINYLNNTAPSSSVFTIRSNDRVNTNSFTYVAYCFAPVAGYSSFGSYVGNGSSDGPFVFTGMRPRWVMIKSTNSAGNWEMLDSARDTYNPEGSLLRANSSGAEIAASPMNDFLSNGFKARSVNGNQNDSGITYIYAAFAESAFQYARAR